MNQQDKLGNALRGYYDSQETPFNDKEWERAGAYLRKARRGRRIRYAVLLLTALLSTLFLSLFHFPEPTSGDTHASSLLSDQKSTPLPVLQLEAVHTPIGPEPKTMSSIHSISVPEPRHSHLTAASTPESHSTLPEVQEMLPGKTPEVFESSIIEPGPGPIEQETTPTEANILDPPAAIAADIPVPIAAQDDPPHEVVGESKDPTENVPAIENPDHIQDQLQSKESAQAPLDVLPQTATTLVLNEDKKEPLVRDSAKTTVTEEQALITVMDSFHLAPVVLTSTVAEMVTQDTVRAPASFDPAGEGIFYEAGAAWLYGWKGPVKRDARGFSPVAGINYMNQLGSRYSLSFGLQYLQVPKLSNSSKTSRVSTYKYGELSRVTVITPSTMHYLVAPLRLHYFADHRNCFGTGVNLAYLLNVDATVTRYDEKPGSNENYETVKLGGYTEGFSWFDSQLAFFYRLKACSSLGMQAEIFLGLTDVKQDKFFGLSHKERNSGAKLTLVYYAFRKNNK